jgi:hypothetical protein
MAQHHQDAFYHHDRAGRRETEDRMRMRHVRDALRRGADAAELDDEEVEELLEVLGESHPEALGRVASEMTEVGQDGHPIGPHRWARDRRERREASDVLHHRRARDAGRRPHLVRDFGPPGVGRENTSPPIENFAERHRGGGSSYREEVTGLDRRRAHDDMAFDSGGSSLAYNILGEQAMGISRIGVIR